MSELKVYVKPIKTNMFGKMIVGQSYYLKSEVDKFIADLEESHDVEIGRLRAELEYSTFKSDIAKVIAEKDAKILALEADAFKQKHHAELFLDERNYAENQLRHQKYKRCLDKAKICQLRIERYERYLSKRRDCDGLLNNKRWQFLKTHYEKWYECWLELAEKFKGA